MIFRVLASLTEFHVLVQEKCTKQQTMELYLRQLQKKKLRKWLKKNATEPVSNISDRIHSDRSGKNRCQGNSIQYIFFLKFLVNLNQLFLHNRNQRHVTAKSRSTQ